MELVVSVGKKWRPPVRRGRGMTSCLRKTEAHLQLKIIRRIPFNKGQSYPLFSPSRNPKDGVLRRSLSCARLVSGVGYVTRVDVMLWGRNSRCSGRCLPSSDRRHEFPHRPLQAAALLRTLPSNGGTEITSTRVT